MLREGKSLFHSPPSALSLITALARGARSYDDYLLKGLLAALGPDQTDRVASYRKLSVWPRLACACDSLRKIVLNLFEFKFARK